MKKTFNELGFKGRLIAVEGLDGSGKSTQVYLLKRWLEQQGLKVFFSEWNSSAIVKSATSKGKKLHLLTPTTFSLIHATDFADRYERQLVPLLKAGYIVLCDRYVFTAFARDVVRGCPPDWVRGLYSFAARPDLTFFFKASLDVSLARILDNRPELKYHEAGMDLGLSSDAAESFRIFQGRLFDQYLAMSTEFNFVVIDANQRIDITVREVQLFGAIRETEALPVDLRCAHQKRAGHGHAAALAQHVARPHGLDLAHEMERAFVGDIDHVGIGDRVGKACALEQRAHRPHIGERGNARRSAAGHLHLGDEPGLAQFVERFTAEEGGQQQAVGF